MSRHALLSVVLAALAGTLYLFGRDLFPEIGTRELVIVLIVVVTIALVRVIRQTARRL